MIRALILDLDGTIYRGDAEVPGAGAFVRAMRGLGVRCLFVTNRANRSAAVVAAHIRSYGVSCEDGDVLTTAETTAEYVGKQRCYLIGETGIQEAFAKAGVPLDEEHAECVVVSLDRTFDYAKLQRASRLIRAGARFILTNPDTWLRLDDGIMPGAGAIGAAVQTASGTVPTIIGKPETLLFEKALRMLGLPREEVVAVGDNMDTDIPGAQRAGLRSILMLTGVSTRADAARAAVPPTAIYETYPEFEAAIRRENAGGPAVVVAPSTGETPAAVWIRTLNLRPHPEGGHFRETYRAGETLAGATLPARYGSPRAFSTAILFLLRAGEFSAFHRLRSDELWHWHAGAAVLHLLEPGGAYRRIELSAAAPQAVVPASTWFASEPTGEPTILLAGCTVSPGFDFADFELAPRAALQRDFPAHAALIARLTR